MNSLQLKLAKVPAPLGGLALGISSLGWTLENTGNFGGVLQLTGAAIASGLLLLLLGKFFLAHTVVLEELKHPVVGSVLPTTAMSIMIIANAYSRLNYSFGISLWLFGIVLHLALLIGFIYHHSQSMKLQQMVPSWFIPPVGVIVAAFAFPGGAFEELAHTLFWVGLISYGAMLPVMLYRLIFHPEVPDPAKPTIAILAAPASLSLAGYLHLISEPSVILVAVLGGIGVMMSALIYLAFFKLFRLPFSPAFSAFTFPLVAGASALFKLAHWMTSLNLQETLVSQVRGLAYLELYVAAVVVLYVVYKYTMHFAPALLPSRKVRSAQ